MCVCVAVYHGERVTHGKNAPPPLSKKQHRRSAATQKSEFEWLFSSVFFVAACTIPVCFMKTCETITHEKPKTVLVWLAVAAHNDAERSALSTCWFWKLNNAFKLIGIQLRLGPYSSEWLVSPTTRYAFVYRELTLNHETH